MGTSSFIVSGIARVVRACYLLFLSTDLCAASYFLLIRCILVAFDICSAVRINLVCCVHILVSLCMSLCFHQFH